ncbi:MAG: hypothetical protein AAGG75_28095 [Bacteroidota bacterium]
MKSIVRISIISSIFFLIGCTNSNKENIEVEEYMEMQRSLATINNYIENSSYCIDSTIEQYLALRYEIGTSIHAGREEGYYCPLDSCDRYDEFFDLYYDALDDALGSTFTRTYLPCEFYYAQDITKDLINQDMESVKKFIDDNLLIIEDEVFTPGEYALIVAYIDEVFEDIYSIDYCDYYARWSQLDKETDTNGQLSAALIFSGPIIMRERQGLLQQWYTGTDPNDPQALFGYAALAVARGYVGMLWGIFEKGVDHPDAGNCGLAEAGKAVLLGI